MNDRQHRIVIADDVQSSAESVRARLRENRIVAITASHHTDQPEDLPFLERTIELALGPPRLAHATGAALLPVIAVRGQADGFEVIIEPPLRAENGGNGAAAVRLLERFVGTLEVNALRYPADWRRWMRIGSGNPS